MTDEEMAEEYADGYATPDLECSFRAYMFEASKEGFLAGLKAGRPQWHDLRKDPNDLPNDSRTVQDQDGDRFFYLKGKFYYENDNFYNCKPSLWCEIPQFNSED